MFGHCLCLGAAVRDTGHAKWGTDFFQVESVNINNHSPCKKSVPPFRVASVAFGGFWAQARHRLAFGNAALATKNTPGCCFRPRKRYSNSNMPRPNLLLRFEVHEDKRTQKRRRPNAKKGDGRREFDTGLRDHFLGRQAASK